MTFSIVITTLNRDASLARCLESLGRVERAAGDLEVLVVDNGSIDNSTHAVFAAARKTKPGVQWRYFYEPMPGLLSGRHRGALECVGDICVFLDDDVRLDRGWLRALEESFQDPQVALTGGPSRPLFESTPPDWLGAFFFNDRHGRHCADLSLFDGGESIKEIDPCYVWGLNFAIRKSVLFDLGGFNPDYVPKSLQRFQGDGDTGLSLKAAQRRLKAIYHPQAAIEHEVPTSRMTAQYFARRAFYQGVSNSYTEIRANRNVVQVEESLRNSLRHIKRVLAETVQGTWAAGRKRRNGVQVISDNAYSAGFRFHQQEVGHDPDLLDWVLRENYWDYRFPDGWQRFWK